MSESSDPNYCDPTIGNYGYRPSLGAGLFFSIAFGIFSLYSLYATIRQKKWFISITLGGLMEMIGWIGRIGAHYNICSTSFFIEQICCLIVAPAFFSATLYIVLGILILRARNLSLLSPRMYIIVFCSIDFVSLLLQAVGGGMASGAETDEQLQMGTDVIVAGVFVQLAGMATFALLGIHFLWKAARHNVHFNAQVLAISVFATAMIFIRNIYRAVELLGGWNGRINTTEGYLIGLDGVCMLLCIISLCYLAVLDANLKDDTLNRNKAAQEVGRPLDLETAEKPADNISEGSASVVG